MAFGRLNCLRGSSRLIQFRRTGADKIRHPRDQRRDRGQVSLAGPECSAETCHRVLLYYARPVKSGQSKRSQGLVVCPFPFHFIGNSWDLPFSLDFVSARLLYW